MEKEPTLESLISETVVGRKERVGCMARVTWTFTLPYVKQIPNGNSMYNSGNSNQSSVTA